jgi:23S rRNA (cytosine1962-C5)-methyltransferase
MRVSDKWKDYEVLDASDGEKLEKWGKYVLVRPDPQVIWSTKRTDRRWNDQDGRYLRSSEGGGHWEGLKVPAVWQINYRTLKFNLKPMGFKHTGLFPEQAVNWDWLAEKIKSSAGRPVKVLNLFAYTGGATARLRRRWRAGRPRRRRQRHGRVGQGERRGFRPRRQGPMRYIVDDCIKFVGARAVAAATLYDGIIMDPPSYGRGPGGEVWKLEENCSACSRCARRS